ncbi:DUF1853 family protein [Oceanimonas pelagia]|uniref:DUF1853 family protein n=1 Tax=Oceanimonas pelagia TaxID=3028314 RepID=A0AA50KRZ2_9GAMM|nr:DUF1853 family protein [Oceanimonas pelagia]WMC11990.1 DUF1853 family protein [Oceanimonas pelagia]
MSPLLSELLNRLTHNEVRDLAWAIGSPSLLPGLEQAPDDQWYSQLLEEYRPRLLALDREPAVLLRYCGNCRRLGQYFEALWHFFLLDHPRFQVLGYNRQQVVAGRTLGAFDLLLWDHRHRRIEHWELAVKFYLITDIQAPHDSALGINPCDRLRRKLDHMQQHQLRLSRQPAVRRALTAEGLMPDHTRLVLKGRLFYPLGAPLPASHAGNIGRWGHELPGTGFEPQQKLGWMTGGRRTCEQRDRQNYRDRHGNWYVRVNRSWNKEGEHGKMEARSGVEPD